MSEPESKAGFFRRGVRTVGREAAHVAGVEHIKLGAKSIRKQWTRASKRICPVCERGRLFPFSEKIAGAEQHFYGCSQCDYYQAKSIDNDLSAQKRLREVAFAKINEMGPKEYAKLVRKYQLGSRWLYAFALVATVFGCGLFGYGLATDAPAGDVALPFLSALAVSIFLFVQGLVASYRHWQVRERLFFIPGAFKRWLRTGQWLI